MSFLIENAAAGNRVSLMQSWKATQFRHLSAPVTLSYARDEHPEALTRPCIVSHTVRDQLKRGSAHAVVDNSSLYRSGQTGARFENTRSTQMPPDTRSTVKEQTMRWGVEGLFREACGNVRQGHASIIVANSR